jgi:hypothetical protein
MSDKTIPQLDPVVTPAPTDRFGVRQAGDTEDKRETREQVHALEDGEFLLDSFTDNISAAAGGGQVGATGLTSAINFVTDVNDAGDGVRLPATFPVGAIIEVHVRSTSDSPDVYPAVGDDLGEGLNLPLRLAPNQQVRFLATVADSTWVRLFQELIQSEAANGAIIEPNIGGASNSPSLIPDKRDNDTGIAANGVDTLFLIANNLNIATFAGAGGGVKQTWRIDVTVTANPGGGQGSAVELLSTWQFVNVVATTGDSVRLPGTFQPGTLIWLKNTGANACDVFPASGDDLGAGVNTAVSLAAGVSTLFVGSVANSIWEQESPVVDVMSLDNLLLSQTPGAHEASPTLRFGDGDSGFFEDADDSMSQSIAGAVQAVTGPDGKLFINTLTGTGFQGSNIESATPANVEIFAAKSATNGVNGGDVELWGGYAAGNAPARGGDVILWGGGAGGSDPTGGDVLAFGGEAEISPGDIILTGGVATIQGTGGFVAIRGGAGFGGNGTGGRVDMIGGAATGTRDGGDCRVFSGASGAGVGADGGEIALTAGNSASSSAGVGGAVTLRAGTGAGTTGAGGAVDITGGLAPGGGVIGLGGAVTITGGANNGSQSAAGAASLSGGDATGANNSPGGAASLVGGVGRGTADGGAAFVTGGLGGPTDTSAGGAVTITGGTSAATNGDGGDVNLTPGAATGSGADGAVNVTIGQLILPQVNDATAPSFAFGDGDTGFHEIADDNVRFAAAGANVFSINASGLQMENGAQIQNETTTSANPVFIPRASDLDSGLGSNAADQLSLIAGGQEMLRLVETGVAATEQLIISPSQIIGSATTPALAFGDGNTGFWENIDNVLNIGVAGSRVSVWTAAQFAMDDGGGPAIVNAGGTAASPNIRPNKADIDTGLSATGADVLIDVIGGVAGLFFREISSNVLQAPDAQLGLTAFATGGQGSATAIAASYAVFSTVATLADSGRLPDVFAVNTVVTVKNDGAADMDLFPATGDDLGAGTNIAVSIVAGTAAKFIATVADATWTQLGTSVAV